MPHIQPSQQIEWALQFNWIRTITMRYGAAFACRWPARNSRCRVFMPLDAAIGHTPTSCAMAASERMRAGLSPATINISAAQLLPPLPHLVDAPIRAPHAVDLAAELHIPLCLRGLARRIHRAGSEWRSRCTPDAPRSDGPVR